MKKTTLAAVCAAMLLGTATVHADDWRGGIRSRIHHAQERIERGIQQGSLTPHEAHRLRGELHMIERKLDYMRDDGRLNERERGIINHDLDRLDRDISREKHDYDRRYRY